MGYGMYGAYGAYGAYPQAAYGAWQGTYGAAATTPQQGGAYAGFTGYGTTGYTG